MNYESDVLMENEPSEIREEISATNRTIRKRQRSHARNIRNLLFLTVMFLGITFAFYVQDYYHATPEAMVAATVPFGNTIITEYPNKMIVFEPENPKAGLIFYPGGKVQYEAYAPLMQSLAQQDILCVLVHMPANLAVLDNNAAEKIPAMFPRVSEWYLAGHSLGGAMGASFVSKHAKDFNGLILLAAYSTADISKMPLTVLSIYGSEDGVMKKDSYMKYYENLPPNLIEVVIPGGCHAGFGDYGPQEGDGIPTISNEEQIRYTTKAIQKYIFEQ